MTHADDIIILNYYRYYYSMECYMSQSQYYCYYILYKYYGSYTNIDIIDSVMPQCIISILYILYHTYTIMSNNNC